MKYAKLPFDELCAKYDALQDRIESTETKLEAYKKSSREMVAEMERRGYML